MPVRHSTMLEVNEFLVLDHVRDCGATTRPEIARSLGMSPATVSRIVGRLLGSGALIETGATTARPGRPRAVIAFNSRAGSVAAIDLGGTKCHGALADLAGAVLFEVNRPTRQDGPPYQTLVAVTRRLADEAARLDRPLLALAIGVPAIVDPDSGAVIGGPNVDWGGFDLAARLRADVSVPFVLDNDVNLAALAHAWRGEARGLTDFVTLSIGTGIGAAIVTNGQLIKGRHNAAGEIGYLVLSPERLHRPPSGDLGAFEEIAAGPAIAGRATELLATDGGVTGAIGSTGAPGSAGMTAKSVISAALGGDPLAGRVIGDVIDAVALAVIALAGAVDPELVILDGAVGRALAPFVERIDRLVRPHLAVAPRLSISELGGRSTVIGAIAAALQLAHHRAAPSSLFGTFNVAGAVPRG